jgi:hypothetical protein
MSGNYFSFIRGLFIIPLLYAFLPAGGQVIFNRSLGDAACYEEAFSIIPATDGYLISAAYNCLTGAANWKSLLIKIDQNGDTLWTRRDGIANGFMRRTADDKLIFIGGNHAGLAYDTIVVSKTEENGDTLWTRHFFFGQCNGLVYDIINTRDGGYCMTGIYSPVCSLAITYNSFVVKMDGSGNVDWTTMLTGQANDELFIVRQTDDNGYALYGWTSSMGEGGADRYLVKLNEQGDSIWSKTYGGTGNDFGYGMDLLPDGGFITIGYSDSIYAEKLDEQGALVWRKSLGVPSGSTYYKALYTADKHYTFIGCESSPNGCSASVFKLDTAGNTMWVRNFGGLFREFVQDGPGTFLMAGYEGVFPDLADAYYVRFDTTFNPNDTTGLEELANNEVLMYPNPANNVIHIKTSLTGKISAEVWDITGRLMLSQISYTGHLTICSEGLADGLYIIQLRGEDKSVVRKKVLVQH